MNGENIFSTFTKNDTCSRIDTCPNRSLFIGLDEKGRPMLLLVTQYSPEVLKSTGAIDVTVGRRKDKLWALTFSLNEPDLIDVFASFAWIWRNLRRISAQKERLFRFLKKDTSSG